MSVSSNLATEDRIGWIRARLDADGSVRLVDAAEALGVSEMTIRRDLLELEALGLARRVRGGAVSVGPEPIADRHRHHARAKAKIADKLVPLLPRSGAIGIDASSTLLRLANVMPSARDLIVLTNGPEAFHAMQDRGGVRAMLTGGELDPRTGSLVGPLAARFAGSMVLSKLFVSAAGIDLQHGLTEPTLEEAEVKRAMAAVATEVIVAVDASKLATSALALGVEWENVSVLVTELSPTDKRLDPYRDSVEIL